MRSAGRNVEDEAEATAQSSSPGTGNATSRLLGSLPGLFIAAELKDAPARLREDRCVHSVLARWSWPRSLRGPRSDGRRPSLGAGADARAPVLMGPPQTFSVHARSRQRSRLRPPLVAVAAPVASVRATGTQAPPTISSSAAGFIAAQEAPSSRPPNPTASTPTSSPTCAPSRGIEPGEYWVQVRLDTRPQRRLPLRRPGQPTSSPSREGHAPRRRAHPASRSKRERDVFAANPAATPAASAIAAIQLTLAAHRPPRRPPKPTPTSSSIDFVSDALTEFWGRQTPHPRHHPPAAGLRLKPRQVSGGLPRRGFRRDARQPHRRPRAATTT